MKKLHVLIAAIVLLTATNVSAQTKIAYISIDDVVGVMPELSRDKVNMDTVGAKFIQDSIMPTLNYKQSEYTKKVADYQDTTKKLSPQLKSVMLKDIQDLQEELSGADQFIQQVQQEKQQEFLMPYYKKAKTAIETVAKEKGYTHVMAVNVFLVAPEADNIFNAVLTKLGIKLPTQNPPANKPITPKTGGGN